MSFRGQPQTIAEVVAYVSEQLRSIQSPMAAGSFVGPKGDTGDKGDTGSTGPAGPAGPIDPDLETLLWAEVSP